MCGIFGVWNRDGAPIDPASVRRSTTILRHRGPDDEGYVLVDSRTGSAFSYGGADTDPRLDLAPLAEAELGPDLAFGFRRLSILDLSPNGHQPMPSADGRLWLVFNGEVYNYREIRAQLVSAGRSFRSESDTEVVLAAYEAWGPACLERFNGMWAIAIWDSRDQSLFIARDRFGVKPVFLLERKGRVVFASEMKALFGPQHAFEADDAALHGYLRYGYLPRASSGQTFFARVRSLPPGTWLRVTRDAEREHRYYDLAAVASGSRRSAADRATLVEEYRTLLADAVRLRLRADVSVGSCLSGGIDSSAIVCLVNQFLTSSSETAAALGPRQKAFSAVYDTQGNFNEISHIMTVLAATHAEANYVTPSVERFMSEARRLMWHQEEPFTSPSIFAQWSVMQMVRQRGVTVLLDGQGADEALAGYRPFDFFVAELLGRGEWVRAAAEARLIAAVNQLSSSRLLAQAVLRRLPESLAKHYRAFRASSDDKTLRSDFAEPASVDMFGAGRDLQAHLLELMGESGLPHLLRFEDRNSMAFGVEARVPFVDYRLMEFSFTSGRDNRIRDGWTKWILREAMRGTVPQSILERRDKVAFATPEDSWLSAWISSPEMLFGDGALSGEYLDLPAVRSEIARWKRYGGDRQRLWRWVNLELWLHTWRRAGATPPDMSVQQL